MHSKIAQGFGSHKLRCVSMPLNYIISCACVESVSYSIGCFAVDTNRWLYRKDNTLKVGSEISFTTSCSEYRWFWVSWQGGIIMDCPPWSLYLR